MMGVLARIARDNRLAEQGVRIGRRSFLGGAAGLALASAFPAVGLAATATIAVVGAGLAGLTAARELRKAGYAPDVFEGSTRIGGRCYSARGVFGEGQVAEHGGEFIDTGHTDIRAVARDLGLVLDDVLEATPKNTRPFTTIGGKPYSVADMTRQMQPLTPILRDQAQAVGRYDYRSSTPSARQFDAMTISQWIATYVADGSSGQLGQALELAFSGENGADCGQQSALTLISTLAAAGRSEVLDAYSDQRFHVRGGNDQIPTRLAKALDDRISTAAALVAIARQPDGRFRLTFKRDTGLADMVYDRVILAVPFSILRASVDFGEAGFRPLKEEAIRTMPIGANAKFQLQFTRRIWTDAGCNGELRMPAPTFQTTWEVSRAQPGQAGILNFYSGGTRALNAGKTNAVDLAASVLKDVAPIMPGLDSVWTGLMTKDAWKDNPWSLGSYSYYPPGYQTRLAGIEAEAEGNCFFAGEHTSDQIGFLNSAVKSGLRAATQVKASLR
jgi:monoamine oxidase